MCVACLLMRIASTGLGLGLACVRGMFADAYCFDRVRVRVRVSVCAWHVCGCVLLRQRDGDGRGDGDGRRDGDGCLYICSR